MCKITDWYFVAKERFGCELTYPMPYSIIKKSSNFKPVLVGKLNGMKVMIDNIKIYNEIENFIVINDEKETKISLENMHRDFLELQENIIRGYPLVYDWKLDENLNLEGVVLSRGSFKIFKDSVISQEGDILTFENSKEKVYILWSTMSKEQRKYMSKLTEKELITFAPGSKFGLENCSLDLSSLIKIKKEKEKRRKFLEELDVPKFSE